jgi:hypothetical protein
MDGEGGKKTALVTTTTRDDGDDGDDGESNNDATAARAWHILLSEDRIVLDLGLSQYRGMPKSMSWWKAGNKLTGTLDTWSDNGGGRVEWAVQYATNLSTLTACLVGEAWG